MLCFGNELCRPSTNAVATSSAAEIPVKFESATIIIKLNLAALRLHEIVGNTSYTFVNRCPGTMPCNQVSAVHSNIGNLRVSKSDGSLNLLHWLAYKMWHLAISPSYWSPGRYNVLHHFLHIIHATVFLLFLSIFWCPRVNMTHLIVRWALPTNTLGNSEISLAKRCGLYHSCLLHCPV